MNRRRFWNTGSMCIVVICSENSKNLIRRAKHHATRSRIAKCMSTKQLRYVQCPAVSQSKSFVVSRDMCVPNLNLFVNTDA